MSEAEQVVDSGQGSEDDVEKEPAADDGGEEAEEEEKEEGYNMLQWSVINSQVGIDTSVCHFAGCCDSAIGLPVVVLTYLILCQGQL